MIKTDNVGQNEGVFFRLKKDFDRISAKVEKEVSISFSEELEKKLRMVPYEVFKREFENISLLESNEMSPSKLYTCNPCGSKEVFVIKTIEKRMVEDKKCLKELSKREFPLQCSLHHENIVEAYEYSENEEEYIMVMEYLPNATYFQEKIETRLNPIKSEKKIRSYIRDILKGLEYIHARGIIHSDLKLENIFIKKFDDDRIPRVKIGDFGLAHLSDPKTGKAYYSKQCGSYSYIAPELKGDCFVDEKIDMWSLGLIAYKMAVAYRPNQVSNYRYGLGPIPFRKIDWRNKSKEMQDFISSLLQMDPNERPSATKALEHPWFSME